MNILNSNPFRVLGIYSGATAREIQRQLAILKRFSEVGKSPDVKVDFEILEEISRDSDSIVDAAKKIEQAKNKVIYALFWFQNATDIDSMALGYMEKNNIEKAKEIWAKVVDAQEPSIRSYSAFLNLSSLLIIEGIINSDTNAIIEGISLKGKIIASDHFVTFMKAIAGENVLLGVDAVSIMFFDEIFKLINENSLSINHAQLIGAFDTFPDVVKEQITKSFTSEPINKIDGEIEQTKSLRKDNPRKAATFGKTLYKNTSSSIAVLKKIFGENNLQYITIADDLAAELLQCGIDYFNSNIEDYEHDPGDKALELTKWAKKTACSKALKDRINENLDVIQEHVNGKAEREKVGAVSQEANRLNSLIGKLETCSRPSEIEQLIRECKPLLNRIKEELGTTDSFFIGISSAVAFTAQNELVGIVNAAQNKFKPDLYGYVSPQAIDFLRTIFKQAWSATKVISSLDMDYKTKEYVQKSRTALKSICERIDVPTSAAASVAKATRNSGCLVTLVLLASIVLLASFIML